MLFFSSVFLLFVLLPPLLHAVFSLLHSLVWSESWRHSAVLWSQWGFGYVWSTLQHCRSKVGKWRREPEGGSGRVFVRKGLPLSLVLFVNSSLTSGGKYRSAHEQQLVHAQLRLLWRFLVCKHQAFITVVHPGDGICWRKCFLCISTRMLSDI